MKNTFGKKLDTKKINRNIDFIKNESANTENLCKKIYDKGIKKQLNCPMCESTKSEHLVDIFNFEYVECVNCKNVYLKDVPVDIAAMYEGLNVTQNSCYIDEDLFNNRVEVIARPKVEYINEFVGKKTKWLDIGCGTGEILYSAKQTGWEVLGYESDLNEIEFARRKKLNVKKMFFDCNNITEEIVNDFQSVDLISLFNTFEHLENPSKFIQIVSENIKPGTFLINEMPRHPSLASFVNLAENKINYRHISPPLHLNIFSEKAVEIIYDKNNLEILGKWVYGQGFLDILNICQLKNTSNKIYDQLIEISNKVQQTIDETGFGDFMIVVARKK